MAAFFAGFLVASALDALRAGRPGWVAPALAVALAAFALGVGFWREGAVLLASAVATSPPLLRRRGWCALLALVLFHVGSVFGRIGTMPRLPAPDVALHAPRAAALERLREALPGEPRVVAGPELRAGLVMPFRLPNPDGYEPAVAPSRVARLGRHLGLDAMSWGAENLLDTWGRLVASPGAARALGIGIVAARPLQAEKLLGAGYRKVADLPGGTPRCSSRRRRGSTSSTASCRRPMRRRASGGRRRDVRSGDAVVVESAVPSVGRPAEGPRRSSACSKTTSRAGASRRDAHRARRARRRRHLVSRLGGAR
jgi:hypothetical protein